MDWDSFLEQQRDIYRNFGAKTAGNMPRIVEIKGIGLSLFYQEELEQVTRKKNLIILTNVRKNQPLV